VWHIFLNTRIVGSERFQVRDPFLFDDSTFVGITFMNAFYVFRLDGLSVASKNRERFHNLLDVYLIAVFFSRLDALRFFSRGSSFRVGWTLTMLSLDLTFKRVVLMR